MTDAREEFLAGERPDDVALYLWDDYVSDERLERYGERVEGGVLIVVDGESGRNAFEAATGMEAMAFAGTAMQTEGEVHGDLEGGVCPNAGGGDDGADDDESDDDDEHRAQFVFAFAEEANEEVGGIYAEGPVIHAYVQCTCGTAYSDRWTVDERSGA